MCFATFDTQYLRPLIMADHKLVIIEQVSSADMIYHIVPNKCARHSGR